MSDEYHNSGGKGSLVNDSAREGAQVSEGNYPPSGDTTSEGGYGGDVNSSRNQRGLADASLDRGQFGRGDEAQGGDVRKGTGGAEESSSGGLGEEGGLQTGAGSKSSDGPGYGADSSGYQDRHSEGYESAAAGMVDSREIGA